VVRRLTLSWGAFFRWVWLRHVGDGDTLLIVESVFDSGCKTLIEREHVMDALLMWTAANLERSCVSTRLGCHLRAGAQVFVQSLLMWKDRLVPSSSRGRTVAAHFQYTTVDENEAIALCYTSMQMKYVSDASHKGKNHTMTTVWTFTLS
jgi:hypothetical protein